MRCVAIATGQADAPLDPRAWNEVVHAVQGAEKGALSAAGRPNERGDHVLAEFNRDVVQRLEGAVEKDRLSTSILTG
jgi:hypothetical protein